MKKTKQGWVKTFERTSSSDHSGAPKSRKTFRFVQTSILVRLMKNCFSKRKSKASFRKNILTIHLSRKKSKVNVAKFTLSGCMSGKLKMLKKYELLCKMVKFTQGLH